MAKKSKLEHQLEIWAGRKVKAIDVCVMEVLVATLRYVDIAIRQRGQKKAVVTIAADLLDNFGTENLRRSSQAYDMSARWVRNLGGKVQLIQKPEKVGQMDFWVVQAELTLEGIEIKQAQKKLRDAKSILAGAIKSEERKARRKAKKK